MQQPTLAIRGEPAAVGEGGARLGEGRVLPGPGRAVTLLSLSPFWVAAYLAVLGIRLALRTAKAAKALVPAPWPAPN